jgi:DNA helicase II / ATP-dependent DNA helicase PcrA
MDLSRLNPPQREAVVTTEGPVLVLAGAGSGKTRVITHRICHLLEKRVAPSAILAVTFTNKAATEMKERVVKMAGKAASGVTICTFHAFGAEILREHLHRMGWPKRFAIADMGDQLSIIKRGMRERQIDDRAFDARKVLTLISRAKNAGEVPVPKEEGLGDDYDLITAEVFPIYQTALKAQGAVDFDDLIVLASQLLEKHPAVREAYAKRLRYLMVDEFQDTNASQLKLIALLSGTHRNVCAVGDDDQCIYGWRGAEVKNILEFEKSFPGAREIRLEQNYRSSQVILDAANAVIEKNPARRPKKLWTDERGGRPLELFAAPSEDEEARYVGREIAKAIAEGLAADEIAVLYRTNGQSRPIEEALRERQISYEVIGGSEFFDRREVKDVVAYLKVLANPRDEVSLRRIVNVPARGIGDVTLERIASWALAAEMPLLEAMAQSPTIPELPRGAPEKVLEFVALLERYRQLFTKGNLGQVARKLLEEIGFAEAARATTQSATAQDRKIRSIEQVIASLEGFERREGPKSDLLRYLNTLALDTREEEDAPSGARVALMTLHGAKGLEFKLVFLIGMEEDLLPHAGMQGEPPNLEEERRLAYVGITRARQKLVLTRASARIKRGKEVLRTPSRFLEDIPLTLFAPPKEANPNFLAALKERLKAQTP